MGAGSLVTPQDCSRDLSCSSFSVGRRTSPATVSMTIPRKMIHVVGPSRLCIAMGTPSIRHTRSDDNKIIQIVEVESDPLLVEDPAEGVCHGIEYFGRRA